MMSFIVFDHTKSAMPTKPNGRVWSYPKLPRRIDGYLKFGSMTSISFVKDPAAARVTVVGCPSGSVTNGILLLVLNEAPMRVKSMPVLPYWFEIHT